MNVIAITSIKNLSINDVDPGFCWYDICFKNDGAQGMNDINDSNPKVTIDIADFIFLSLNKLVEHNKRYRPLINPDTYCVYNDAETTIKINNKCFFFEVSIYLIV